VPATEKPAALLTVRVRLWPMGPLVLAVGVPNVTVPGPLTTLQVAVRVPLGKPSSVITVPDRLASEGRWIV